MKNGDIVTLSDGREVKITDIAEEDDLLIVTPDEGSSIFVINRFQISNLGS